VEPEEPAPPPSPPQRATKSHPRAASLLAPVVPAKPAAPPPLAPLGRKMKQRIARGRHAIDGRLDLHGLTQAEAHGALVGFLRSRQQQGAKVVLVITGKGRGDGHGGRGVLNRLVPLWLRLPEFRSLVVGFEAAAIGHGGEGALYVSLRRER
jgi:DNA-nicking Smr family endonuclease